MGQIHLGLHTIFKKDGVNFVYLKGVFDANLVTTGDYWNDDPRGIGPQRIYTVNYNSPMGFYAGTELGLFLKADEKSELSIWGSYKVGFGSLFDFNYLLAGSGNYAEYNIDGSGNKVEIGVKYSILKQLNQKPKDIIAKKEKEPKPKKEKETKPKKVKEPKEKKEKTPKELKVDRDGVPKTLKDRTVDKGKPVYVSGTTLTFKVWDSGAEIDGDTISLNLNGEWIVKEIGLKKERQEITVEIDPTGKNFLIMYALNLGIHPPNTASISVWDGEREQKLQVKSDLGKCGALNIIYRPKK